MAGRKPNPETVTLADHLRSIASKGGQARAESMTDEELKAAGKAGGQARAANMTASQRKKAAQKAAAARWGSKKPEKA